MALDQLIPYMPPFQAVMNAVATVLLGIGWYYIRQRRKRAHRNTMILTLAVSLVFLISYTIYHMEVGYMPFAGQGWIRPIYFSLLISHIILAVVIVPLVLGTVWFAARGNFTLHPRIARWTLPIWMYVSLTGVVVYLLAFHVYAPDNI